MSSGTPRDLEALKDTVKPYVRHVLVCAGRMRWGPRVEERDDLLGEMARDVNDLSEAPAGKPKLTALLTEPRGEGMDLLVYPEAVRYVGVDADAWARIRDEHLREGRVVEDLSPEPLTGHHLLVCVHGERDERCGRCGPVVAAALNKELASGEFPKVTVHLSSHVGGHKYAGNVLVYPEGVWYGYVQPEDVRAMLQAHFGPEGEWREHLRGRMRTPQA